MTDRMCIAFVFALALVLGAAEIALAEAPPGQPGAPYQNMPALAPIGVRVDRYLPLPQSVAPPPIDPATSPASTIWAATRC